MTMLFLLFSIPMLLAGGNWLIADTKAMRRVNAFGLWLHLLIVAGSLQPVLCGLRALIEINTELVITRLSAAFIVLTCLVVASCLTQANFFFAAEEGAGNPYLRSQERAFYSCASFFLVAMTMVFIANNLGFLWIAVEATTLSSAPLVYLGRTKNAIEATWKYLIICSVGIAFALLGTVFIFASSQQGLADSLAQPHGTLNISSLIAIAPTLSHPLLRLGFLFCFLGYGTKAGMFPIHSWLPDAHSEAPAPASAMLSGALLNCALFAIWRVTEIVNASGHGPLSQALGIWVGVITTLAASLFLVRQHGLKRLWAYSSIENVGLMLTAIGIGSGSLFFLQALNHSIAKVALFLLSGNVVQFAGTKKLSELKGIFRLQPVWAVLLFLAAFAVTGAPPFGAFISEWLILSSSVDTRHWLAAGILLFAIALSFIAVCGHLGRILFGPPKSTKKPAGEILPKMKTSMVPLLLVACSLILGLTTGGALWRIGGVAP